jgi:amidase
MDEILALSATEQAALIRNRKVSSVELVQAHLGRVSAVNPTINAAVDIFEERSIAGARAADEALARRDRLGPLHGVPFTIKDSIELAGSVCTAGTVGRLRAEPSAEDAIVVRRLRLAGAIPIAKTNQIFFSRLKAIIFFTDERITPMTWSGHAGGVVAAKLP